MKVLLVFSQKKGFLEISHKKGFLVVIIAILVIIDQPECVAVDDINVASLASVMRKILAWD